MKRAIILASLAAVMACTPTRIERAEPIIEVREVKVPVDDPACARAAVAKLGTEPAFPDTPEALRKAANLFERVKLLLAGRMMRTSYARSLAKGLRTCAGQP